MIPEVVRGELLNRICRETEDSELNAYFENNDFKIDGDLQFNDSLYYDKYENKNKNLILLDSLEL